MSTLLLDLGNTRVKWALLHGSPGVANRFERRGAFALHADRERAAHGLGASLRALLRSVEPSTRVYVCCVAGEAAARTVRAAVRERGLASARFARTEAQAAGVRNGYREPWRLGVDRWLALIGARREQPGHALCIASIGTALAIDLIDAQGRHRGGTLIPGPTLMIEALLTRTAGVARRAGRMNLRSDRASGPGVATGLFAHSTREALHGGALHACAALIERARAQARVQFGLQARVLLTGGGAQAVGALLRGRFMICEDLVLSGLAVRSQPDARPGTRR